MRQFFTSIFILILSFSGYSQVVTTEPALPTETDQVIVTFHADEGTGGLKDYSGDVYAHTGVITNESTSSSDWKHTISEWGENEAKTKLERVDANTYQLTISPDIRTYYEVPDGETVLKLAFVFRSGELVNGSYLEGKDTGSKDIFVNVYEPELTAVLTQPVDGALFEPGQTVEVEGQGQEAVSLELLFNGTTVTSITSSELSYSFSAPNEGSHQLILVATGDDGETDADTVDFYIREPVVEEAMPTGLRKGVNILDDNSVTLVLQAPYKSYVYVLGDFNDWEPRPEAQMKKDGEMFWLTLTGLEPGEEYAYQYYIDGEVKVADPYANKVLDPWNDKYIPERIYPNLKSYPEGDGADGIVSVFTTTPEDYEWQTADFTAPDAEDLIVYELLIRDFTENQDIKTVTDTLDYLQRLGINAIELMPFNEFEGNDSWGYNPSFYFATDKAYGTFNDFKEFVDECHARGIAVIMDLVLNHSYGQSPLAQMYLEGGKPAENNPWYNREHNMQNADAQWGYDFNHESPYTQELVDSITSFWMTELRVDGFRFDFTKGFTNTPYGPSSWASDFDASRINILKRMADKIWEKNPDAYVIFEHLSENSEEKVLADHGILLWGNMNYSFGEAIMGYHEDGKSDFSWASYKQRGWSNPNVVAYMESHDEERLMFKAQAYGNSSGSYEVKELENAADRFGMAAVFLMSIPGPKMIWQFGEMGYDISIDDGGRLSQKPPKWEYLEDYYRETLWMVFANIINLKKKYEVFSTADFELEVNDPVKYIRLNGSDTDVRLVGNFGLETTRVKPLFSKTGWWYNHFVGDSVNVSDQNMEVTLDPGEFAFFTSSKLEGFRNITSSGPQVMIDEERIRVYPNPVSNTLTFQTESDQGIKEIAIYDYSGRMVFLENVSGRETINVSGLHKGVYLLKMVEATDKVYWQKIVKQ
ncbi:alpha-amylase family glycosyl hydrolase [Thermophagus sp. OGC60D27]|uniref:alpha-amylase family glycosyl hydrolase n=1 Tax=Thermophagus sp. OGC60D27 TaxID=3458415 RepID=UPI00403817C9